MKLHSKFVVPGNQNIRGIRRCVLTVNIHQYLSEFADALQILGSGISVVQDVQQPILVQLWVLDVLESDQKSDRRLGPM
jgi:hypothetical protein